MPTEPGNQLTDGRVAAENRKQMTDEFLSMETPVPQLPESRSHSEADGRAMPRDCLQLIHLRRQDASYHGRFVSILAEAYGALQPQAASILHPEEMRYFLPLPAERRRISFLLGRYAAKRALQAVLGGVSFSSIHIAAGVFKNPVVCYPMKDPWQVSITHSDAVVCALAFPMVHPMALDIEIIDPERVSAMASQCLDSERAEAARLGLDEPTAATLLWTAKEALSKVLHTGMMCPFQLFEVQSLRKITDTQFQGLYKHMAQYQFHAWKKGHCLLTVTLPKLTEITFENGSPRLPSDAPATNSANEAGS